MNSPFITVDLAAYSRNLGLLRSRVHPAEIMAIVKADAYGHGLIPVSLAAVRAGVGWIGSLDIPTGRALRNSALPPEVRIFAWLLAPDDDFEGAIGSRLDLGVSTIEQLERIADVTGSRQARVHLKIDTGLHRNGASAEEWPALVARTIALAPSIDLVGVWTHISEASEADDTAAIHAFHDALSVAAKLGARIRVRHLAASAASNDRADARFDLVRIGAFAYGIAPGSGVTPQSLGIEPVMTLTAPVTAIEGRVARVGIGFADGIFSGAAGRVHVTVRGHRLPIIEVALDHLTIDITADDIGVTVGDDAILFGSGQSGEETLQQWGDALNTIGEEIVTRIDPRMRRRYLGQGMLNRE